MRPQLIGPVARSTPSKGTSTRGRRPLPDDLLRDASLRLGVMSLVSAGLWTLATVLGHLALRSMSHGDSQWLQLDAPDAIAASSVVASVLLYFYTRKPDHDPRRILNLGLGYMVLTAIDLGLVFHWGQMPMDLRVSPLQ